MVEHKNIIKLLGTKVRANELRLIVLEFCLYGTLSNYLKVKYQSITLDLMISLAAQIAEGSFCLL